MAMLLTIGDVSRRTNVSVATLRVWEGRHGFPEPERLPSGHRRYREDDCEAVRAVVALRAAGFSLEAAVARVKLGAAPPAPSFLAGLRAARPGLGTWLAPKRALTAISHAIEDEYAQSGETGLLVGGFQRIRFYRREERRWRDLARTAAHAFVFADFQGVGKGIPVEIPLTGSAPLAREWAVIVDAPRFAAALVAAERPGQDDVPDGERCFDAIWTAEPALVRTVASIALANAAVAAPGLVADARDRLHEPGRTGDETVHAVTALTNRIVGYVT
jgi:MerR family transcriptional regulator, light-induced transcriptional regulator